MNLDRLRWGEWIAAIAALDLLVVTFRAWYKVSGGDGRVTAWDALEQGRYLLIATAVVGVFLLLIQAAEDTQRLSFPPGWLAAAVGFACTVYVAYRLATPPSDNLDPDIGLFLGLASALGVTIGGLLSAREAEPAYAPERTASEVAQDTFTGPTTQEEPLGALVPDSGGTWNAAPATTGWSPASPAAPAAPVPPATPAGALGGAERPLQSGDSVVLTAGGARFPSGTVAEVIEAFAGGALVEVRAPDGMAERFEVPESAFERAPAGAASAPAESWSPAMPAPASEDWGFDESAAAAAGEGTATGTAESVADEPKKVPWWKREIGGGKKKDDATAEVGAAGAVAAGAAAIESETNGAGEQRPGFFKRLFGGGGPKDETATETIEPETTPASDVAAATESDTAVDEPAPEPFAAEPEPPAPEPEVVVSEPEPEPPAPEPEVVVSEPEPEPPASAPQPAPPAEPEPPAAPEPEVVASEEAASAAEPAAPEPEPEPEPPAPEPEPEPAASEPEVIVTEPDPIVEPEPPAPAPDPGPQPEASAPDPGPGAEAVGAGAAAAAAASADAGDDEPAPTPKRKRSSGSRKVPKEALAAADASAPKVGDEVQLKVGGGKFDAGTKGTVVDVFSAGVIVELSDDEGRTERLDLPFEAIGPADA